MILAYFDPPSVDTTAPSVQESRHAHNYFYAYSNGTRNKPDHDLYVCKQEQKENIQTTIDHLFIKIAVYIEYQKWKRACQDLKSTSLQYAICCPR